MKAKKGNNKANRFEKGSVETLLQQLNGHLQEYLIALKAVTDTQEYHHLAR